MTTPRIETELAVLQDGCLTAHVTIGGHRADGKLVWVPGRDVRRQRGLGGFFDKVKRPPRVSPGWERALDRRIDDFHGAVAQRIGKTTVRAVRSELRIFRPDGKRETWRAVYLDG